MGALLVTLLVAMASTSVAPGSGSGHIPPGYPIAFTHDFEDIGGTGTEVLDSYVGAVYSSGTYVWCIPNYNYNGYPPSSGDCVVADTVQGFTDITLDLPVTSFEADFVSNGITSVTITGFDSSGNVVAQSAPCGSPPGDYVTCGIEADGPVITKIDMRDSANYWGFDSPRFSLL